MDYRVQVATKKDSFFGGAGTDANVYCRLTDVKGLLLESREFNHFLKNKD